MSRVLALFPLHVVLFPGRPLPLHVFEPRYRELLEDCLAERLDDGRSNLVTRGAERFRIRRLLRDGTYLRAEVDMLDEQPADAAVAPLVASLRTQLESYLQAIGAGDQLAGRLPSKPAALAWLAAGAPELQLSEQQRLLEIDSQAERREHSLLRRLGHVTVMRPHGPAGATLN